jgi:hypothetical protein
MVDVSERPYCGQIVRGHTHDLLELRLRFVVLPDLQQCTAERDTSRQVGRMADQPGTTGLDRVVKESEPTILVREGGEGDGRRVLLDPALQFVDTGIVRHLDNSTLKARP